MFSKWNVSTKLGQLIEPHVFFYIGIMIWFHNSNGYMQNVVTKMRPSTFVL